MGLYRKYVALFLSNLCERKTSSSEIPCLFLLKLREDLTCLRFCGLVFPGNSLRPRAPLPVSYASESDAVLLKFTAFPCFQVQQSRSVAQTVLVKKRRRTLLKQNAVCMLKLINVHCTSAISVNTVLFLVTGTDFIAV